MTQRKVSERIEALERRVRPAAAGPRPMPRLIILPEKKRAPGEPAPPRGINWDGEAGTIVVIGCDPYDPKSWTNVVPDDLR